MGMFCKALWGFKRLLEWLYRAYIVKPPVLWGIAWKVQIYTEMLCFLTVLNGSEGWGDEDQLAKSFAMKCMECAVPHRKAMFWNLEVEWGMEVNFQKGHVCQPPAILEWGPSSKKLFCWELYEISRSAQKSHVYQSKPPWGGVGFQLISNKVSEGWQNDICADVETAFNS